MKRLVVLALGIVVIGWLFWTGHMIGAQNERAALIAAIWRHVGYGVVTTPLLLGYFWFRTRQNSDAQLGWIPRTAYWGLFACISFLVITGPVVVWTYGSDLKVFDWFVIPNPLGGKSALHDRLEAAHVVVAKAIPLMLIIESLIVRSSFRRRAL